VQPGARRPFHRERLRYDEYYALELGYAVEHGVPWKEYVKRWSLEDRSRLIAYLQDKSKRCTNCGTAPWEWLDDEGNLDPEAFAVLDQVCHGCAAKDRVRLARETDKTAALQGASLVLVPKRLAAVAKAAARRRPMSARERAGRSRSR
jgi:hypothetical protein